LHTTELRFAYSYSIIREEHARVQAALLLALLLATKNNSSKAITWLDVKFSVKMASYALLDADEVGVAYDRVPIHFYEEYLVLLRGRYVCQWSNDNLSATCWQGLLFAAFGSISELIISIDFRSNVN